MGIRITEMTIGEIIGNGLKMLISRFPLFILLELIIHSPVLAIQLALPDFAVHPNFQGLVTFLPMVILGPIGTAALLRVITQDYLERPVSLGEALSFALGRFPALLGTSFLAGLGMMLGFVLCFLPGIYLAIVWSLVNQVVVMENLSGSPALTRSRDLVVSSSGRVLGIIFFVVIIAFVPATIAQFALNILLPHLEIQQVAIFGPRIVRISSFENYAIVVVSSLVINAIAQAFMAICMTLLYFDLRNRTEAFNIEQIDAWSDQYRSWRDEPDAPFDAPPKDASTKGSTGIQAAEPPARPPITEITENKPNTPPQ